MSPGWQIAILSFIDFHFVRCFSGQSASFLSFSNWSVLPQRVNLRIPILMAFQNSGLTIFYLNFPPTFCWNFVSIIINLFSSCYWDCAPLFCPPKMQMNMLQACQCFLSPIAAFMPLYWVLNLALSTIPALLLIYISLSFRLPHFFSIKYKLCSSGQDTVFLRNLLVYIHYIFYCLFCCFYFSLNT